MQGVCHEEAGSESGAYGQRRKHHEDEDEDFDLTEQCKEIICQRKDMNMNSLAWRFWLFSGGSNECRTLADGATFLASFYTS